MIEHGPNPYLALYYVKTENREEMDRTDTGILQGNAHSGSILEKKWHIRIRSPIIHLQKNRH